jgi:predicted nucleic acid-binding protein
VSDVVYLDTSAVLRAVLERGLTPEVEHRLAGARFLITSRLSLVETARAFSRLRADGVSGTVIADATREAESIWARCTIWELTATICQLASHVAPQHPLRTLDALHLATFLTARHMLGTAVTLLTADECLERAAAMA